MHRADLRPGAPLIRPGTELRDAADSAVISAPAHSRLQAARTRIAGLARFGSVGLLAYVVDLGLFNLLRFGPGELLEAKPLTAKVLSVAVATMVAWLGNRYWTFSDRRTSSRGRELAGFVVVNLGGLVIGVGCLAFSHHVLGFTSPLADNISANVVGLALGTVFRDVAYRRWCSPAGPRPDQRCDHNGADSPRDPRVHESRTSHMRQLPGRNRPRTPPRSPPA